MRGDLSETTLPAICRSLASDGATGRLVLDSADGPGLVTLRGGSISDARSPQPRARLADRLTGGGHLDELTLARVLHDLRSAAPGSGTSAGTGPVAGTGARAGPGSWAGPGSGAAAGSTPSQVSEVALARALLEQGLVDPLLVEEVMVGQVVDALFELSLRRSGPYSFLPAEPGAPGAGGPQGGAVLLDVEVAVTEIRRRGELLAGLPPATLRPDTVPHLLFETTAPDDQPDADAVTLLAAIDDDRNVRELAALLGYGSYDLAIILAELYERGIVALTHPQDDIGAALDLALRSGEETTNPNSQTEPSPNDPTQLGHDDAQDTARRGRDPDGGGAHRAKVADWVFEDAEVAAPADAAQPDAAQPDAAQPDAAQPDPVQPEPLQPDPVQLDPAHPDASQPDPAHPDLVLPDLAPAAETREQVDHEDTDVSEFLRELSALALGDTAPRQKRSSSSPAPDPTGRHDREGGTGAGRTPAGGAEEAAGQGAPEGSTPNPDARKATDQAASGRDAGRKRRKGLFGRG